jgi:hypothetical protein
MVRCIPHLAKNERDVGHPRASCGERSEKALLPATAKSAIELNEGKSFALLRRHKGQLR